MPTPRACGDCYNCCIDLGIDALKKYSNQPCKYLSGVDPQHRCSIYSAGRPEACVRFQCAWLMGWFQDADRPKDCGFMAHFDERDSLIYITFHCDSRWKMEHLSAPGNALHEAVQQALLHNDVVQVMFKPNTIVVFRDGMVQQGIMFPQPKGKYEDLKYGATIVGKYEIRKVT